MGNAECLVQIQMAHVGTKITGPRNADHGVHVGAVHVDLSTVVMHDRRDFLDAGLEDAVCRWVRHHQGAKVGRVLHGLGTQVVDIDVAVGIRLDHHHRKAGHDRARRIRAMRRLRNEAHGAMEISARMMIGANNQESGILALRTGIGLQRHAGEPGHFGEILLELTEHRRVAFGL